MAGGFHDLGWGAAVVLLIWAALDLLAPRLLRLLARALPDDICGPGGWYVDTERRRGIFDGKARRSGQL